MRAAPTACSRRSRNSIPRASFDLVVNLQGDLPTLDPRLVRSCLAALREHEADIGTIAAIITREEERTDPNVVKVVGTPLKGGQALRALYFTRATAPYGEGPLYHHIGIYAYRRQALHRFVVAAAVAARDSARSSSSSARSKPACASMSASLTLSRSVSILRPTSSGRVSCFSPAADFRPASPRPWTSAFQQNRLPGRARRQFASRRARRLSAHGWRCLARPSRTRLPA